MNTKPIQNGKILFNPFRMISIPDHCKYFHRKAQPCFVRLGTPDKTSKAARLAFETEKFKLEEILEDKVILGVEAT